MSELKESFFDEIQSRVKKYSLATDFESISKYFGDKNGVVISTLHGVKGEEYTTVIAAGLLNGYLPHWDYIMNPTKNYVEEMRHVNFFMFFALGQKRTCIYLVNVGELQRVARNILQQTSYP